MLLMQTGTKVQVQFGRGGFIDEATGADWWVGRAGWRVGRVLCADPANAAFAVVAMRCGRVVRMVNPACMRVPS